MQIEISLLAREGADYEASDLGFLLHKHPGHLHERDTGLGTAKIFYSQVGANRTTCVLYLDVDPVGLVRGKNRHSDGLLTQYVNDRPFCANSLLSVAIGRAFGQSLSGKSKERQDLAERVLPFEARVVPVAAAGGVAIIEALFAPLGYQVETKALSEEGRGLYDLRLAGQLRLRDLLNHLYVLVPVLDDAKHYWVDRDEIDKLLAKGESWLASHPNRELITRRALKHRRALANLALSRLAEAEGRAGEEDDDEMKARKESAEEALEAPIRLHDLRLDCVAEVLKEKAVRSVLDLGCGEGKLLRRLLKERQFDRIVGVDASTRSLERAAERLHLDQAGEALRARLKLEFGGLTYADRRWRDFDAAVLVEVIEHIDPPRLSSLELSLFADARPRIVIVTTPNREYNALFENMAKDSFRHPDHRFEWTRAEFETWAKVLANRHGYAVTLQPLGPEDQSLGAPSQMAFFFEKELGSESTP